MRRAAQRWSRRDGGRGGGGGLGGGAGFTASAACTTSAATSVFSERADAIPNASRPVALRAGDVPHRQPLHGATRLCHGQRDGVQRAMSAGRPRFRFRPTRASRPRLKYDTQWRW
jgi:hypothetical protein